VKHLILLVLALIAGYALWNWARPIERREGVRVLAQHAVRLGVLLALAVLLLVLAYYLPAIPLL
jgi:hypothetical protein